MLQQPLLDAQQRATSKDTTGLILVTGGSGKLEEGGDEFDESIDH